jgi:hypothetical protein
MPTNEFRISTGALLAILLAALIFNAVFYMGANRCLIGSLQDRLDASSPIEVSDEVCTRHRAISSFRTSLSQAASNDSLGDDVANRWREIRIAVTCWSGLQEKQPEWVPVSFTGASLPIPANRVSQASGCGRVFPGKEAASAEHLLYWYPIECLLNRLVGVQVSDGPSWLWNLMGLHKASEEAGLEGTLYHFTHRRIADLGDPQKSEGLDLAAMRAALDQLDRALLPEMRAIQNTDGFFWRRFLVRSINDPFQWTMFAVGWWCTFILVWRWVRAGNKPNEGSGNEERRRRHSVDAGALSDTLVESIPTMGFIGTVVGMILAMGSIGGVLSADRGPELYAAMAEVTSGLSLAFNTTFVGLLMALPLGYLRRKAMAAEQAQVDRAFQ